MVVDPPLLRPASAPGPHRDRRERAFTLIELLVVMIIIAILMAVAIPTYLSQKVNAVKTQTTENIRMIQAAIETCALERAATSTSATLYGRCVEHDPIWAMEPSLKKLKKCCSDGPPAPGKYDLNGILADGTRVLVPNDTMAISGLEVYAYMQDGRHVIWLQLIQWPDGEVSRRCGAGAVLPSWSRTKPPGVPDSRVCKTGTW